MSVTMRDVAARAKVSVATVSKSLRGAASIPLGTRTAVLEIATQMGYRIHPYVSALMRARSAAQSFMSSKRLARWVLENAGYMCEKEYLRIL